MILLSNDPDKSGKHFLLLCGNVLSTHRNVLIFKQECINLQKGSLRYKMSLNFILKGCFSVCVSKDFDQL